MFLWQGFKKALAFDEYSSQPNLTKGTYGKGWEAPVFKLNN
jgi:hypothetical protein